MALMMQGLAGLVLLDMIDFYEDQSDIDRARELTKRVRHILTRYAKDLEGANL